MRVVRVAFAVRGVSSVTVNVENFSKRLSLPKLIDNHDVGPHPSKPRIQDDVSDAPFYTRRHGDVHKSLDSGALNQLCPGTLLTTSFWHCGREVICHKHVAKHK
jgi:hypothetical protein